MSTWSLKRAHVSVMFVLGGFLVALLAVEAADLRSGQRGPASIPSESGFVQRQSTKLEHRSATNRSWSYTDTVTPFESKRISYEEAWLEVVEGAVGQTTRIAITPLRDEEVPDLGPGMTNVTKGPRRGYRFTPDGCTFSKKLVFALPYDASLVPAGLGARDVYTFYFDEQAGVWRVLERVEVDERHEVVLSLSDHFTEMINATVIAPDHPTPLSFNPTSIRDIQAADPAAAIDLIEPPEANSFGSARLSYPIALPPGRNGLEPVLELVYDSSRENGWLGLGWDLPLQSVTIDTRWGVPRYDYSQETETYLLNGEQLTPVAHRGGLQNRSAEKVFHTRVEGEFRKIIRHGERPNDYWWEVIDKLGTRFFYGGGPDTGGPTVNATLADASGNVFQWSLREVHDTHGNFIKYRCARVSDPGVAGGTVQGSQLYLRSITYTGHRGREGLYEVTFIRDRELKEPRRPDVMIDARGGFKVVTADLLKKIEVRLQGDLIRSYALEFEEGAFSKTILSAIVQYGSSGVTEFNRHSFEYYDNVREAPGTYHGFDTGEEWYAGDDGVSAGLFGADHLDVGQASALSGSISDNIGGHLYLGFNLQKPTKQFSGGAKVGYQFSATKGVLALIDLNGDDLPDKVFETNGDIRYRPNLSGPGGKRAFGDAVEISTLSEIDKETSHTISLGPELYFGLNVLYNFSFSFVTGSTYFTDANGDGLTDLASDGRILFNHFDPSTPPVYATDNSGTPVPIECGSIDSSHIIEVFEADYETYIDAAPLHDTLRRWTAPRNGSIRIDGDVTLVEDTSEERQAYETADGVRVAIQRNSGSFPSGEGVELWFAEIGPEDYSPKAPGGVQAVPVTKGDRIYFRVQSVVDGRFDQVAWDPQITYVDGSPDQTDANGLDTNRFKASEDFALAGRRGIFVEAPLSGTVRLAGTLRKTGVTTDDITLRVTRERDARTEELPPPETLTWTQVDDREIVRDIEVEPGDRIRLRIEIDSPIDLGKIHWIPELFYIESPDLERVSDDEGNFLVQLHPPYDIDIYPEGPPRPVSWRPSFDTTLYVFPCVTVDPGVPRDGEITFTVKRPHLRKAKQVLSVGQDLCPSGTSLSIEVADEEVLFFDFSANDPDVAAHVTGHSVQVCLDPVCLMPIEIVPSAFHSAAPTDLFPGAYRGWSYAGYEGNRERASRPINEDLLDGLRNEAQFQFCDGCDCEDDPECDCQDDDDECRRTRRRECVRTNCGTIDLKAYPFYPVPAARNWRGPGETEHTWGPSGVEFWQGPDEHAWVSAGRMSSSRVGLDHFDVPRPADFVGDCSSGSVPTVTRRSRAQQHAVEAGALIFSGSYSTGASRGLVDYLDMNGDRFPDIVSDGKIQYTTMVGSLEESARNVGFLEKLRENDNKAYNFGVGGSPATFKADAKGRVNANGKSRQRGGTTGSQMVALGLSGSLGEGDSDSAFDLLDINGDGLPDRVSHEGDDIKVRLNLGYRFDQAETWGTGALNAGESESCSIGASLGFNGGIYDFAGGLSLSQNVSRAEQALLDINGDDLPDLVSPSPNGDGFCDLTDSGKGESSSLSVWFNTGAGFAPKVGWQGALNDDTAKAKTVSLGGGVYFTIGIGPLCPPTSLCYIIINPGVDGSRNMSREEIALRDLDGDRNADHVFSDSDGSLTVARNRTDRTNLLKTIHRPLGATIKLEYERDGNTYDLPHSRWNLSRVEVFDGHAGDGVDALVSVYRYDRGNYNRNEREFYGYRTVIEEQRDAGNGDRLYRTSTRTFLNDNYYNKGLLEGELVHDAAGRKFTEAVASYRLFDVDTQSPLPFAESTTATVFPQLVRTDQFFYEGLPDAGKSTFTTHSYDALGNMVEFFDAGDTGTDDDVLAAIEYFHDDANYIVGKPDGIVVTSNGVEFRRRGADIEPGTGNIRQVRAYLENGQMAVTDLDYFENGNLQRVTGPANLHGNRYTEEYEYDSVVETHITAITDSFGYRSAATYNFKYGREDVVTDINGNHTDYDYDAFGRTSAITGPYESGGPVPTLRFQYHPEANVPWALTRHIDSFRNINDPIDTVLFTDGLGHALQIKKDATIHAGPDASADDMMIVSGRMTFDFLGRVIEQYYPTTEPLGNPGLFSASYDALVPTRLELDVLDRTIKITLPDGTSTTKTYGFGTDRGGAPRFEIVVTDPNGIQSSVYRDVRTLVTSLRETNQGGAEVIWTSYVYDPLRQLVGIEDTQRNSTRISYDNFGRRTVVDNPDTGRVERRYDLADNVVAKITDKLRSTGQAIQLDYEHNRLTSVTYPDFPGNNASYTYGVSGAPFNRAGRVTTVTDQSGSVERFYGKLGEIVKEIKTVASDTRGNSHRSPEVYTTEYMYDTWCRLQELIYPDGEVLAYRYDSGGLLNSAIGIKQGFTTRYVTRSEYNRFDQRAFLEAGNAVRRSYTYDPLDRRLLNLRTTGPGGEPFQNLYYTYDDVGNIREIHNDVPVPRGGTFGGPVLQTYRYDDLYRLVHADASHTYAPNKVDQFDVRLAYDSIHNIIQKNQQHELIQPSGVAISQRKTSYQWSFQYDAVQPHAPSHIGDHAFTYDANGNQLGWTHDRNGTRRTTVWDEENRIQSISDNGHTKRYKYDDTGRRVIKRGPQGETAYVNPYFTVRNRSIGTKHVYAGATLVASKLSPGFATIDPHTGTPDVNFLYFYHSDHLGSSSFATDGNGKIFQHLEYFPFGETWVQEKSNTQRTPYLFSANEFDEATGLYYDGPRYYDPRTSVWQTAGTVTDRFLDNLSSSADPATYRSLDLNLYAYGYQNPVMYFEQDGQWVKSAWNLLNIGVGSSSFPAGTTVATEDGFSEIQGIEPGDVVSGVDEAPGALGQYPVTDLSTGVAFELITITVGNQEIAATAEHLFRVDGKGWVEAENLVAGDSLVSCDGTTQEITATACQEGVFRVFNFEVDWAHTYCVSEHELLVHNGRFSKPQRPVTRLFIKKTIAKQRPRDRHLNIKAAYFTLPVRDRRRPTRFIPGEESSPEKFTFMGETRTGLNPGAQYIRMVRIKYTGSRAADFRIAGDHIPGITVLHHFHDYDPGSNTGTLYLMRVADHAIRHSGGVWQYEKHHSVPYRK